MVDEGVWARAPERFTLAQAYHDVAEVIGWDRAIDFGMAVWESRRPPSRRNGRARDSRGYIYVPSSLTDAAGVDLVALAGKENAARLAEAFGGNCLTFPNIVSASIARRNRTIARQVAEGSRIAVVACAFDLTERQVRRIVRQEEVPNVQ